MKQRGTYKRRSPAAGEKRNHSARFCPRCSLRITKANPLATGRKHCALCEHELTTGRIAIGIFEGG